MPNTNNFAEVWQKELLAINVQNALTSPFMTSNVKWLDAKTFHFTQMSTSGFRNHSVGGAFKRGVYTQTDVPFTLAHDRNIEFLVDKREVDETNETASIQNVAKVFEKTQATPEVDVRFFEQVYAAASGNKAKSGLVSSVAALSAYTKSNIIEKIKAVIAKVKRYRGSLICYIKSELMDLLELALADKAQIQWVSISGLEFSISTRVANIDGVPVMEVLDDDRFISKVSYLDTEAGGFTKANDGLDLTIVVASTETCKTVKKISSIYYFAPGNHTEGDGYLYQEREFWDTFVFPNGKDGKIDSVAIEHIAAAQGNS